MMLLRPFNKFGLVLIAFVLTALPVLKAQAASLELQVPLSHSKLLVVPSKLAEVAVADPAIADVVLHGARRFSVVGKALGRTTVRVFDGTNKVMKEYKVQVVYDLPNIRKAISTLFPGQDIGVEMVHDNVAVIGAVSDATVAEKVIEVVHEFVNTERGTKDGDEPAIINLLKIRSGQQVMLRVRVGEIRRTSLKKLGVNLAALRSTGSFAFALGTSGGIDPLQAATAAVTPITISPDSFGVAGGVLNGSNGGISSVLEALESNGLFKVLAEPNLVAISGEKAEFLAGGEFPIPVAQNSDSGGSSISVEFKTFGVSVQFVPYVIAEDRVRLVVQPEVSELSDEGAVEIGGLNIPALTTRRAKTTIELAPGESFMIAGLLRDQMQNTIQQVPGLSEIPVLSALFRSTDYQRNETELVIAVTPYLVDPILTTDLRLPTDNFQPASLMESFFYGALAKMSKESNRISQSPVLEGPVGFMVD